MFADWRTLVGQAAGLLTLAGLLIEGLMMVYKGKSPKRTTPQRATWFIWAGNALILSTSYKDQGAQETEWLGWAYLVGCSFVALLTIKYGRGGWTSRDKKCLLGAVVAACIWPLSTFLAFACTLVIDLFGVWPTIDETHTNPESESKLAWALMLAGSVLAICALPVASFTVGFAVKAVYPVQVAVTAAVIVGNLYKK